jgi:hypothetical protein
VKNKQSFEGEAKLRLPRKVTATKLTVLLGVVVVVIEGYHLYLLEAARLHARMAIEQAVLPLTTDKATIAIVLREFDQLTHHILLAATGPYLILAVLLPAFVINLLRLQNTLSGMERAVTDLGIQTRALTPLPVNAGEETVSRNGTLGR